MKKLFLYSTLLFWSIGFSQNEQLAQYYFDKGDFEKAKISYEELCISSPQNMQFFTRKIECLQQLKQFEIAEKELTAKYNTYKLSNLLVELGYNYQLQKSENNAQVYYNKALDKIKINAYEVYAIAANFEKKILLEKALQAYELAEQIQPTLKFNYQKGVLYGQLGNMEKMIETFLDEAHATPQSTVLIQNQMSRYMNGEGDSNFGDLIKKALIIRVQKDQDVFWNEFLSWYYVQQKEFSKAFIQEKSIYKRNPESLDNIINLAKMCVDEGDSETAKTIFDFVLESTKDKDLLLQSHGYLMQLKIDKADPKDYEAIKVELETLLTQFEINEASLSLQLIQAHFLAFQLKKPELAKAVTKKAMSLPLDTFQKAKVKMELADILLFEEKFNQALLYYSQIENDLKNDELAHEASLKAAKTSYFKTDFTWALKQFKELKSASTQLIANDALDYFLLINDNNVADSTQTALKEFAKGDYLLYQNRNLEAVDQFLLIEKNFKGQEIEAVTLLRLGKIYEKTGNYPLAISQYQAIIEAHSDGIYIDEALYFLAEIYTKKLQNPELAKPLYEKILFNHQDSIYYVEARKSYRTIRGDKNL
ncbi:MAG: hypothetical protein QG594_2466 [Bacteroidota bacterium]|nr:hypothetical protein [Bacteroidota bacterium]